MTLVRTTLRAALIAGIALAACGVARAQPVDGLYVGAGAGYNMVGDVTAGVDALAGATGPGVQTSAPMRVVWGGGYVVSASLGYGWGNGLRTELEGSYRNNDQTGSGGGRHSDVGLMGNVLYDLDIGLGWVFPYVGVGAGYQSVTWRNIVGHANGVASGGAAAAIDANQGIGSFAYQAIAGLAFPIDSVPGMSVTAEYRYMALAGTRDFAAMGTAGGISAPTRARAKSDASHSVLIGLRYGFDTQDTAPVVRPPPVAEQVPAPSGTPAPDLPARTYLVFFDWDSAELSPRAREIIAEAVHNSARVPHTRIDVTGHTDRTGPSRANLALSLRRANVVADELERAGVPAKTIDIHGVGDSRPLVPTAEGVRQPENRRVEIVYR